MIYIRILIIIISRLDLDRKKLNYLKNSPVCANVATGGEPEATDEASTEVGEDVPVEVGHHQDVIEAGVLDHVETNCVQISLLELDLGVFLGSFTTTFQEQPVAHPHDVGFVDGSYLKIKFIHI